MRFDESANGHIPSGSFEHQRRRCLVDMPGVQSTFLPSGEPAGSLEPPNLIHLQRDKQIPDVCGDLEAIGI